MLSGLAKRILDTPTGGHVYCIVSSNTMPVPMACSGEVLSGRLGEVSEAVFTTVQSSMAWRELDVLWHIARWELNSPGV